MNIYICILASAFFPINVCADVCECKYTDSNRYKVYTHCHINIYIYIYTYLNIYI
jgi:hypothetical protein